jgi:hypothetical protein
MKRRLLIPVLAGMVFFFNSCGKSGGGSSGGGTTPTPPVVEQNLSIALNPDPGTGIVTALSSSYAFKLLINSTPPAAGVKIDITGTKESDGSVQFSQTSQTSSSSITSVDLSLNGLVQGIVYVVKIDVTSLSTSTNKASISFKIARK